MNVFRGDMAAARAAAARAADAAGEQARRVLEDPAYQRTLPAERLPRELDLPDLPWLGPLLKVLLYAGLAVVVGLLLLWLVQVLLSRRGTRDVADGGEEGAAAPALDVRLEGPDRLADAGRFAEAIHALLLETLAALSRASALPPSFTSREILARARLPARAREALSGLVLAVEVSRFGGAEATAGDYRACLDRFEAFLASYRGPAGPGPEVAA